MADQQTDTKPEQEQPAAEQAADIENQVPASGAPGDNSMEGENAQGGVVQGQGGNPAEANDGEKPMEFE